MSWLSSVGSSVGNALSGIATAGNGLIGGLLGIGGRPGPQNPYPVSNPSFLSDTSKLDFLKNPVAAVNPTTFNSLLNNTPSNPYISSLPSAVKTVTGSYTPPGFSNTNTLYQNLINSTNAPSSVDQVRQDLNNQQLQQLLTGIDKNTAQTIGSLKSDFLDRGLGGPGMLSDIEANALANAYTTSDQTKAAAETQLGQSTLDLLKNRETMQNQALTGAAQAGLTQDQLLNNNAFQAALTDANTYNQLLGQQASLGQQGASNALSNQQLYYNLLNNNQNQALTTNNANTQLLAQLINARDLGMAGIQSTNYNTATGQQYQYQQPGLLQTLLNNTKLNFSF